MTPTRRQFLSSALAGTASLAGPVAFSGTAAAIEPVVRVGKPRLRLALAAYSFRQYLELKKPTMDLEGFIDHAAGLDLDAVELTAYYFPRTTPDYLAALKGRCTRLGLDVSGTAVGNNFCLTDPVKLKEQQAMVRTWVEHTARLGGKTVRIFAGTVGKEDTEEKAVARAVEQIQEACDFAGRHGVYLALENHGGITATAEQLLGIVKQVKHDWFGVNLDTGNFRTEDPYADLAKIAPYAVVAQLKTEIFPKGKPGEEADLARLVGILRDANFRGYLALEYEARGEPKDAVAKVVPQLQKLLRG